MNIFPLSGQEYILEYTYRILDMICLDFSAPSKSVQWSLHVQCDYTFSQNGKTMFNKDYAYCPATVTLQDPPLLKDAFGVKGTKVIPLPREQKIQLDDAIAKQNQKTHVLKGITLYGGGDLCVAFKDGSLFLVSTDSYAHVEQWRIVPCARKAQHIVRYGNGFRLE